VNEEAVTIFGKKGLKTGEWMGMKNSKKNRRGRRVVCKKGSYVLCVTVFVVLYVFLLLFFYSTPMFEHQRIQLRVILP
jgi:hypothetical protein